MGKRRILAGSLGALLVVTTLVAAASVVMSGEDAVDVLADQFGGLTSEEGNDDTVVSVEFDALPGDQRLQLVRDPDGDQLCLSGSAADVGAGAYFACNRWEDARSHGAWLVMSSAEGFQAVVFVPGGEPYGVRFEPDVDGYEGAEVFHEDGLVVVRGPVAADRAAGSLGRVVVERPDADVIVVEVEPGFVDAGS